MTIANILQLMVVAGAIGTGFWGTMSRMLDFCLHLMSYSSFVMRFASSKVSLSQDLFGFGDSQFLLTILVVVYAVLLVMYFELSNGVIRFSMLDT